MKIKKHYTKKEILEKFENKSDRLKLVIYEKALKLAVEPVGGSYVHCIARAMGYGYSDDYDESTWVR